MGSWANFDGSGGEDAGLDGEVGLEGQSLEAGDKAEVFFVERDDIEAEVKGGCSDDEVGDCNGNPDCGLFALDAPGKLSYWERDRMDDEAREGILNECTATFPAANLLRPIYAVGEFDGANCG